MAIIYRVDLAGWDEKYRSAGALEAPTPLLTKIAAGLPPGRALDLACGAGRNALWLAGQGWDVTAVDGSAVAIAKLRERTGERTLRVNARVADLERGEFAIEPEAWDLIAMCFYLQRDLIEAAKLGVRPGGVVLTIVHIPDPGGELTRFRMRPGELRSYFSGWEMLHDYEGAPLDALHKHWVAEIAARRPA